MKPRVWIASGTVEEVAKNLQQAVDEDGIGLDGKPRFHILAMTQSTSGEGLTVLVLRQPHDGL